MHFFALGNKKSNSSSYQAFVLAPLKNGLFELEIVELICGKEMKDKEYNYLEKVAKERKIKNWKYSY